MKTAILLTTYNGEKYLPAQLASLSAQMEADFTVRYQDDGSTDGTQEILRAWAERDPRFIPGAEQGQHLGAVRNFFSLLRQTDAEVFLFCDQDDVWEPEKVAVLLASYQEAAESAKPGTPLLIHSDARVIDGEDRVIAPSFFRLQGWDPGATGLNRLLVQNNATGCMMLLNRPLADLALRYGDPEKMFMHDWFLALSAAAFGRVVFVDQPLTRYRQHGDNAIGASRSSLLQRGMKALGQRKKAKARIALTYRHARDFRDAYGAALPPESARLVDAYLATEAMPKPRRLREIRRLGCLMQSPVTRAGQYFFG